MFSCAVLAVSVLRKKCSRKKKSNNEIIGIKSDFLGGTKDSEASVVSFRPEITLKHLRKMEQLTKSLKNKPIDKQPDAFDNDHHEDAKIDSAANGNKDSLTNRVVNEVGSNSSKTKIFETDDDDYFNLIAKISTSQISDLSINSPMEDMDEAKSVNLTRSRSENDFASTIHHSNTFPLDKSSNRRSLVISDEKIINILPTNTYNNNALQITGTKILNSEPVKKETKPHVLSKSVPVVSSPVVIRSYSEEIFVDPCIARGTTLTIISARRKKKRLFNIDVDQGRILWESKKSGKVNIENIKELRIGEAIRSYRELFKMGPEYEERWFTIVYVEAGKYYFLHLVADTADLFNKWVENLQKLYLHRRDVMGGLVHLRKRQSIWLKQHWKQANKDGDTKLIFEEVSKLCLQLNINISDRVLKEKFKEADKKNHGWLNFEDFQRFVKIIKKRPEEDDLFESLAKTHKNILTLEEFKDFLINIQKCNPAEKSYDNLYYKFCDQDLKGMNLEGFDSFLMSSDNSVFSKLYQDMRHPLSHYFIDSSHNTYLLGHQLKGDSSIEGYIRVLQQGCRCVEIDCWDGPDGRPLVTHGHTWTTKILFQDAITAINNYAFKASPYPLILSLEVHCSIGQQNQMAHILSRTLGEHLVTEFFAENETELPSPEQLMYRILLKGKNLPHGASEDSFDSTDTESATDPESDVEPPKDNAHKPHKKPNSKVAKSLSDLVVYCSAVKFKGFSNTRDAKGKKFYHVSSLSEKTSTRLGKSEKDSFIQHNARQLTRIYPSGMRINSSNYEPHHQWMTGCQMVALNWQKFDLGMQINQAMFGVNGRCGYVLKPEHMCNTEYITPTGYHKQALEIEIISAQQLPRPKEMFKVADIIDPFVEVELLVPGLDVVKKKTRTISNNGFNPVWKETMTFTIDFEYLELVFLRFCVWDVDVRTNDFIAYYCIPVASLQQGYRYIPLHDANGDQLLFATLFVRVSLEPIQ